MKRAAIIAVGSEMLGPLRQDSNSLWIAGRLEAIGTAIVRKAVVGDDAESIGAELAVASAAADIVFMTGGLGPTADDLTVAAAAKWMGLSLDRNAGFVAEMRRRFESRGLRMAAVNEKQADFIVGARVLSNARGTAPGFWVEQRGKEYVILPGVPSEMKEIMEASVLPELARRSSGIVSRRRILRIAGMGESAVEEIVAPVYAKWKDDPVTILASPGEVQLHLRVTGEPEAAERRLAAMEADFRDALGTRIYGIDDEDLPAAVGRLLRSRGATLALAESCTGGMIAALVTDVPGSSDYFLGGIVSYANSAKRELLDVSEATLSQHGAVSDEAAREMAWGARTRFGAGVAAAVTGIAGPDGATPGKPVGTVYFAVAGPQERETVKRRMFPGDRAIVRRAASLFCLHLVRRQLMAEAAVD
ncbi:MAG TPA: competence/damage-inducible protein A [Thermoanaerobaculia bacterium]|nr:competence/damage-inducible protein A [Thermoanaerobaculia bacterium]